MRRFMSSACFTIGGIWASAAVLKLLFGVRLTLPLLPPLGLERVAIVPSIAIGLSLFAVGAFLAKGAARAHDDRFLNSELPEQERLASSFDGPDQPTHVAARQPERHRS